MRSVHAVMLLFAMWHLANTAFCDETEKSILRCKVTRRVGSLGQETTENGTLTLSSLRGEKIRGYLVWGSSGKKINELVAGTIDDGGNRLRLDVFESISRFSQQSLGSYQGYIGDKDERLIDGGWSPDTDSSFAESRTWTAGDFRACSLDSIDPVAQAWMRDKPGRVSLFRELTNGHCCGDMYIQKRPCLENLLSCSNDPDMAISRMAKISLAINFLVAHVQSSRSIDAEVRRFQGDVLGFALNEMAGGDPGVLGTLGHARGLFLGPEGTYQRHWRGFADGLRSGPAIQSLFNAHYSQMIRYLDESVGTDNTSNLSLKATLSMEGDAKKSATRRSRCFLRVNLNDDAETEGVCICFRVIIDQERLSEVNSRRDEMLDQVDAVERLLGADPEVGENRREAGRLDSRVKGLGFGGIVLCDKKKMGSRIDIYLDSLGTVDGIYGTIEVSAYSFSGGCKKIVFDRKGIERMVGRLVKK